MKKLLLLISGCILVCAIPYLSGCNKYQDVIPRAASCQIVKLKGGLFIGDSLVITYDNKDRPIRMTRASVGTGSPNYVFLYDKKGRLSDFYSVYEPPNPYFENWHRYQYDDRNRIVTDTSYSFGYVGPGVPLPSPDFGHLVVGNVSTYKYDSENRIIQATDFYGLSTLITSDFVYNRQGNIEKIIRQSGGSSSTETFTYDDKIGLRRTNPVWQFLDRDFSVNNSMKVSSYNRYGLPVDVDFGIHGGGIFATVQVSATTITYNCGHH
ncbi:hypothetical protein COR50_17355 [Chitinophaga caeni]|uniref:DUF4595 domain-containing protein n=1 Tax=Chitinophaga caeni TaxID=2029983 RepID=A0A291QXX8_9BACT|nr:hypothetical protein [Chitinophaga caeni]ATL48787.1 hypothetical protein COR50_17355 [Chitinophaga caeni]